MDLNVGEFVRTKNGYIGKIENINDFRPPESKYAIDIQMGDLVFIGEDLIAKNNEDIIDLIEVEDIVEVTILGEDTEFGATDPIGAIWHIRDESMLCNIKQGCKLGTFELESILTHEAFNARKYQVNEEEEER